MSAPVIARIERLEELTADMKSEIWGEGGRPSLAERLVAIETMLRGSSDAVAKMTAESTKVRLAIVSGIVSVLTSLITLAAVMVQAVMSRPVEAAPKIEDSRPSASVTADAGGFEP